MLHVELYADVSITTGRFKLSAPRFTSVLIDIVVV